MIKYNILIYLHSGFKKCPHVSPHPEKLKLRFGSPKIKDQEPDHNCRPLFISASRKHAPNLFDLFINFRLNVIYQETKIRSSSLFIHNLKFMWITLLRYFLQLKLLFKCMECKYESVGQNRLKIGEVPAVLVTWLPLVDFNTQSWIVDHLRQGLKLSNKVFLCQRIRGPSFLIKYHFPQLVFKK